MLLFIIECASEINYSNMMFKNYDTRVKLVEVCMKLLLPELLDDGVFSVITVCYMFIFCFSPCLVCSGWGQVQEN